MHILDILFIAAAAFFVFTGARRGLIGEIFRLAGLAAGFIVAFIYFQELGKHFHFNPQYAANAAAFTVIFLAVLLAVIGTGQLLKKAVHLTPLGWVDSIFGGAIGGCKTVLIFWVICLSCAALPPTKFVSEARRSFVFQTYKRLPPSMKLPGLMKTRTRLIKGGALAVPQKQAGKTDSVTAPGARKR
jgi:uncharacterized membrane protein required for colicin V production